MMTEGPGSQQTGNEPPLPGLEEGSRWEEAAEHQTYGDVDFEDNELHAAGRTCVRCGQAIAPGEDVRRTVSGDYEHESC